MHLAIDFQNYFMASSAHKFFNFLFDLSKFPIFCVQKGMTFSWIISFSYPIWIFRFLFLFSASVSWLQLELVPAARAPQLHEGEDAGVDYEGSKSISYWRMLNNYKVWKQTPPRKSISKLCSSQEYDFDSNLVIALITKFTF